jgi:hypothetical protein
MIAPKMKSLLAVQIRYIDSVALFTEREENKPGTDGFTTDVAAPVHRHTRLFRYRVTRVLAAALVANQQALIN